MIDEFDLWRYSDDSNCWDFVCAFLKKEGVELPRFGICPSDKRGMTKASKGVIDTYLVNCEPRQNAIACHYHGGLLLHVGVVDNGRVRHAHIKLGSKRDTIKKFESRAPRTEYKIPKCLL